MKFRDDERQRDQTTLTVAAGEQRLSVFFESEAEQPVRNPDPTGRYRCVFQSEHRVSFVAEAGERYRFYAEGESGGYFRLTAYKILSTPSPEAVPVPTVSQQVRGARKVCRFYPQGSQCVDP